MSKTKTTQHKMAIRWDLEPSWAHLGALLGRSWGHLGAILGPPWGHLGPSWGHIGPSWAILAELKAKSSNLQKQLKTKGKTPFSGIRGGARSAKLSPKSGQVGFKRRDDGSLDEDGVFKSLGKRLGPVWAPSWAVLGPFGRHLGPQEATASARVGPARRMRRGPGDC